jgi:hypothetical protein
MPTSVASSVKLEAPPFASMKLKIMCIFSFRCLKKSFRGGHSASDKDKFFEMDT